MPKNKSVIFAKLESIILVCTFFSLWLTVVFEDTIEHVLAFMFILSFGILHGANDLTLIQRRNKSKVSSRNYLKVLIYYVLFVLGSILLFYVLPSLALVVFILFSSYHFGEQHLVAKIKAASPMASFLYFAYGNFILFLLFLTNEVMTTEIINSITGHTVPLIVYEVGLMSSGVGLVGLSGWLFFKKRLKMNPVKEVFFLGVFFVVFKTASLLWGFAIYFILWHSIPSLVDQIFYLHGQINRGSFKTFVKNSLPYWLISVVGILFLLFMFRDNLETSLAFFFSFLAAITFPHVLVIKRLNQNQN
jgi:Brp/Blh family beta-carotene 15,15'-monooxygenase